MQALMLAAGMGKRLGKYTNGNTKCMVEIAGKKLIDRAVEAVEYAGINKFVIVTGYKGENLENYIKETYKDSSMEFVFIHNSRYDVTNNIYSLYLAKDYLASDDTILLESDLIYDKKTVKNVRECEYENVAAVAKYESWMDGTVTLLDEEDNIVEFIEKKDFTYANKDEYYKTVNIYKFSKEFSSTHYLPFLEAYIKSYGENEYYELVLKAIAHLSRAGLKAYKFTDEVWYEIDDAQDLDIATALFSHGEDKLKAFYKRFGGYWRFEGVKDFCYLVNPYFPPKKMVAQMQDNYLELLTQYPSGMGIQSMNAGRMFGVDENEIIVGNGAAEIIAAIGRVIEGSVGVCIPTFNEYIRCFENHKLEILDTSVDDYQLKKERLIELGKKVDNLIIINPDNPSGSFIDYDDLIEILEALKGKRVIVDESFVDFADKDRRYTMISSELLKKYENLVVIKSISKSYGVPGIRLGVVASTNHSFLMDLKDNMAIWNINSLGEYFLQIITLYQKNYMAACDKIADERNRFMEDLKQFSFMEVYPSQANYVLVKLKDGYKSKELAIKLLEGHNILIKDLEAKVTFEGKQYVRIAVRDKHDDMCLVEALKNI